MRQKFIKPYHLFQHQGGWYIINVEGMFASAIDEVSAGALAKMSSGTDEPIEPSMEELLEKLGLLEVGGGQPPKAKKELKKEPLPDINLSLFLTQSCNLRCVYCYGDGGGYGGGGNMAEQTALQAIDWLLEQAGKIKKLHIGFFGGEPFLNFLLMKTVTEYAKQRAHALGKDVAFHTTTNATLLDDEKIDFIKEHRIDVLVSFDGSKELQDAQRPYADGEGSYDATVPKIKRLLKVLPQTPGHAVIVGNTDPKTVKGAMQEIGFTEVSIKPTSQSLFAGGPDATKPDRDTQHLLQALEEEAAIWLMLTQSRDSEALQRLKTQSGLYEGLTVLLHNSKKRHACGAGLELAAVSAAGDIYLCHRFVGQEQYKLGSVFVKDLIREEYQKSPVTESAVCSVCFAKYYCAGGCKHDNASSTGLTTSPSKDICRLRSRELELAATVICRLDPEDKAFLVEHKIFAPKPCPLDF